jgi:hypothetical protein
MRALWKNVRQTATIAVGKMTATSKDEDPTYILATELLRKIDCAVVALGRTLSDWVRAAGAQAAASSALSAAFAESFGESEPPYFAQAGRARDGVAALDQAYAHLTQTHIPHFCIEKLSEFQGRIRELCVVQRARKNARILMLSEEKKFREAQEKHSRELPHREERFRAQKIEYERYHEQFISGMEDLERAKAEVFGRVFHCYQFYLMELVELQQESILRQNRDIPFQALKEELPSALTKIEVAPVEVTVRIDLSDDGDE